MKTTDNFCIWDMYKCPLHGWLLLLLMSLPIICVGQEGYQRSVNKGFSFRTSIMADVWKGKVVSKKYTTTIGPDFTASFGLSENIAVFGSYQYLFSSKLSPVEVGFLLFTDKVKHQNFAFGVNYIAGSTSSRLRYMAEAGGLIGHSTINIYQELYGNFVDIKLKGLGFHSGAGIEYFISPFLSCDATLGFNIGKYKSSEYLGVSYKESLNWNRIQIMLGIHYHFAGR